MGCITSIATIKGKIKTAATVKGKFFVAANLLLSGVNSTACPLIISIDGGLASTTSYPAINGLLNGGSA